MSPPTVTLFTQIPDELTKKYGVIRSAVYGRVRRYTMKGQACEETIGEIATELNLGERTVRRHLDALEADGYIRINKSKGENHLINLTGALQFAEPRDEGAVTVTGVPSARKTRVLRPARPDSPVSATEGSGQSDRGTPVTETGDLRKDTKGEKERRREREALRESVTGALGFHGQLLDQFNTAKIDGLVGDLQEAEATADIVDDAARSWPKKWPKRDPKTVSPPTIRQFRTHVGAELVRRQVPSMADVPGDPRCYHEHDGRWVRSAPTIALPKFGLDPYTPVEDWPPELKAVHPEKLAEVVA